MPFRKKVRSDEDEATGTRSSRPSEGPAPIEGFRRLVGELIEHVPSAMFALDGTGRVLQTNARFEALVGISRHDFLGASFEERLVAEPARAAFRRDLDLIRAGESDSIVVPVETAHGSKLSIECDVRRYGRSESSPWLVTVLRSRVERSGEEARPFGALAYVVVRRDDSQLVFDDGEHPGESCYRVLYARDSECPRCPVHESISTGHEVQAAWIDPANDSTVVVRARSSGTRVRCERVVLRPTDLEEISRARVESRVEKAGLSTRERDVLAHLRLGRTLEEIATLLGISHHTVKFHTANILQKLGADSRLDLLRILG